MIDDEQLDKLGETNSQFLFDKLKKNKGLADVGEDYTSFHFKTEKDVRGFRSDLYFANSGGRYGKLELQNYTDSFYFDDEYKESFNLARFSDLNEWGEITEKDDKSGKELNNPTRGDVKKYKVYVKNDKGNVVKVEFGDPNMEIKRDDPERRKAFRARHNCDQKKDKTTAGYWSCKFWSTKSVTDLMKG